MLNPGVALVMDTALNAAHTLSLSKRALLYRGLAEICGSPEQETIFLQIAEHLESADAAMQTLNLHLFEDQKTLVDLIGVTKP